MSTVPDFVVFYRAVNHGRDPLPWQRRLAEQVAGSAWPTEIGVPTGLGKTSCLDVAVWALARQAQLPPAQRRAPTRTWYVVNRRLLVDAAYDHGLRLARLLTDPASVADDPEVGHAGVNVIDAVADALQALHAGAGRQPLSVSRLRGGAELGARPVDPSQPALIFATVPMYGSRWLFRGYGTSALMRPVDAALAGVDSLVLLDEAHLASALHKLTEPLAACDIGDPTQLLHPSRARPVFVAMTATGSGSSTGAFSLDDEDLAHPIVRRRLDAAKPVSLVTCAPSRVTDSLVDTTISLLESRPSSTAIVFTNDPGTARAVFDRIRRPPVLRRAGEKGVQLLTGRVRDRDAQTVREALLNPVYGAPAGRRPRRAVDGHLIVVATQTLEVGADLDFDVLVTEACGARALVQRLGRLNRLGDIDNAAAAIVYAPEAKKFGVYGEEPHDVCRRLKNKLTSGVVDLRPAWIAKAVATPTDTPGRLPELLPAHVWEWAKTTHAPDGEADPALFFAGFDKDVARISVAWRAYLPPSGHKLRPALTEQETVEVPLWEAQEKLPQLAGDGLVRLAADKVTVETVVDVNMLRPGDSVVLPVGAGGYDVYGWAPDAREAVLDLSLLRPPGVPLTDVALRQLVAPGEALDAVLSLAIALARPPEPDDGVDRDTLIAEFVARLREARPSPLLAQEEWDQLLNTLVDRVDYSAEDLPRLAVSPLSHHQASAELRSDAFDELSFSAASVWLDQHLGSVGQLAGRIAQRLGLPAEAVASVETAGGLHDAGKIDERFQRWLDPTCSAHHPVAKSARPRSMWERDRRAAGWPLGGRHEELSLRLSSALLDQASVPIDRDLVLHLVVSHHGRGRPLVLPVTDPSPIPLKLTLGGTTVTASGDLADVDWSQASRFRRCCERYGYWGLALLEAIVRQADHQLSTAVAI